MSRYPICIPLPARTANLVVQALVEHVIQHYGCPRVLLTDNAPEFKGRVLTGFCKIFGISQQSTPAYSPSRLAYMERYHAWQAACMTILTGRFKDTWDLALPIVSLTYRVSAHKDLGLSPFNILRGSQPRMPYDVEFDDWPAPCDNTSDYTSKLQSTLPSVLRYAMEAIATYDTQLEISFWSGHLKQLNFCQKGFTINQNCLIIGLCPIALLQYEMIVSWLETPMVSHPYLHDAASQHKNDEN